MNYADKEPPLEPPPLPGFGYYDSADYEPKPEIDKWIIEGILPMGFGFIAGLPKGSNSPHGGKSVYFRQMAHSIITGKPFLGHEVLQKGNVLVVNIDESIDDQVAYFRRLCGEERIPGFKVSKARSLNMPEDLKILRQDIIESGAKFCNIDPLLRTTGGKDIQQSKDTSPIMNELKKIYEETGCTIALNHHSQKNDKRNKESSATWLNGSVDLDSAWDFCIGIEWSKAKKNQDPKDKRYMHARCFMRKKPMFNTYYEAITVSPEDSAIINLVDIPEELIPNQWARKIYIHLLAFPSDSAYAISQKLNIPKTTVQRYINEEFKCLKKYRSTAPENFETLDLSKKVQVSDTKKRIMEDDITC